MPQSWLHLHINNIVSFVYKHSLEIEVLLLNNHWSPTFLAFLDALIIDLLRKIDFISGTGNCCVPGFYPKFRKLAGLAARLRKRKIWNLNMYGDPGI